MSDGLLVLLHGRGGLPEDLLPALDVLDPDQRLEAESLRGPEVTPDGRYSWFGGGSSGLARGLPRIASTVDELVARHGPRRTVLVGYSQGGALAYALALGLGRERPAGLVAISAFLPPPAVPLDLAPPLPAVAIVHGRDDDVVPVEHGRAARDLLQESGAQLAYHEPAGGHLIDPAWLEPLRGWPGQQLR